MKLDIQITSYFILRLRYHVKLDIPITSYLILRLRYRVKLEIAEAAGMKKNLTTGLSVGMFGFVFACCEALAFW